MESKYETLGNNGWSRLLQRFISPLLPSLLVSVSYVDPGKFSAAVEGGSRFGNDLVWLVLFFNVAAILCQYLSAHVAIATGKDLTQMCNEEYDKITCFFLGVQAELSMILLELTMVLGAAHGINSIFGTDLFTCVFLTMMAAFLFPLFAVVHENAKAKILYIFLALAVMMLYFIGVLVGQPDASFSFGGVAHKVGGESAFVLMGLLGASIMPHNFYLHSSVVQRQQGTSHLSKDAACYEQFFVTAGIFSCIFMLNYALMNLAANVFYSAGLVVLTFQDGLSLLDQVYRSSLVPFALVLILFFSNQIVALTWNYARRMVIHEFLGIDIPVWLHHSTIRIIAVVPALFCVWNAGAEGLYHLLVFSQILVALMLPSSVIPLFRIASSRALMGACKISRVLEFMALLTFICMICLKAIFVKEMVFGNSDWASTLRWSIENDVPVPYVTLLVIASSSFCFMLWLAATPLKSASSGSEAHVWEFQTSLPESLTEKYENDSEPMYPEKPIQMLEPTAVMEKTMDNNNLQNMSPVVDVKLPETLLDSENFLHLSSEKNKSEVPLSGSFTEDPAVVSSREKILEDAACTEVTDGVLHDTGDPKSIFHQVSEKPLVEGGSRNNKDGEHSREREEGRKDESENSFSLSSDGPASFKSLHGISEETGSGTGSLSRLAGLGRAARRQMTLILDEFWGQLFDFHGQPTQEARAKKLDVLLGVNSKVNAKSSPVSVKQESRKDLLGYYSSSRGQGSESLTNSSLYNSPQQQLGQGYSEVSYGVQQGSSPMFSTHMQSLDSYVPNSRPNSFDASERRYSSLRAPATSEGYNQQPATVHGYQLQAYIERIAKERGSAYLNGRDLFAPNSASSLTSRYGDSVQRSSGTKPQSSLSNQIPPGFQNVVLSRNSLSQTQRPYYDHSSPKNAETTGSPVATKKYYSLPDISGLRIPHRDTLTTGSTSQWDNSMGSSYLSPISSFDRNSLSSPLAGRRPVGFSGHSPSEVCRDAFSLQFSSGSASGSIWSRQPNEQFGVAEKSSFGKGERIGMIDRSNIEETPSAVDVERKLIQSFRYCILRLLKLEGSDWLFTQNDGADEDLIDRIAARERFHHEAETNQMNQSLDTDPHFLSERKSASSLQSDESDYPKSIISLSPYCGEGCIYRADLIVSFGLWCIHRILELSLMESRPELWGKYTYVLNRLQGIVDLAFLNARPPPTPCFCLDILPQWQQKSKMATANGSLPPTSKIGRGKPTTGAMMLELVKDVEIAISSRKGRSGTAAGDVAFPKGKENLASVLKRYKRRLSSKPTA
ncbi:hypothetical protein Leryth_015548 [Lithospermum erythrorhizon]|nr:hypothetical protein Leryth_015548 [Lithospermum erythrorhizon]